MGLFTEIINQDQLFEQTRQISDVYILNRLPSTTQEERSFIRDLVTTTYAQGDEFTNEPTCGCSGKRHPVYLEGTTCQVCKTTITPHFEDRLVSKLWIEAPVGTSRLINPIMLAMLSSAFSQQNFNYIAWMCKASGAANRRASRLNLEALLEAGIEPGYENFVSRFDEYIEKVYRHIVTRNSKPGYVPRKVSDKQQRLDEVLRVIQENRSSLFTRYVPLPNRTLIVVEKVGNCSYVDQGSIMGVMDVVKTMQSIDVSGSDLSVEQVQRRTANCMFALSRYYLQYFTSNFNGKKGMLRRHLAGTRTFYSMRSVISSATKPHQYDELQLPWSETVNMMELHIKNKLMRRGYSLPAMHEILYKASYKYDPLVHEVINELIAESFEGKLWFKWNRNPTQKAGSIELFWANTVKTDVNDHTITTPSTNHAGFNLDYDGDEMNALWLLDRYMIERMRAMAPHYNVLSDDAPGSYSGIISFTKPMLLGAAAAEMASHEPVELTAEQIAFISSICD